MNRDIGDLSIITPPTPRSEPEDPETESESSFATKRGDNTMASIQENPPIIIGTLSQRQAASINHILSKIYVKKPLGQHNWYQWADGIRLGLASAMFDSYLDSDEVPEGENPALHTIICRCVVTWLTSNMDQTESDRALGYVTSYSVHREKIIDYKPAFMWDKMRGYHASQSIEKRMMLRDSLDDAKQGPSKDLLKHIDEWSLKLKSLLDAQEPMTVEEQAGRLARSLNPCWRERATDYIGNEYNTLDPLIAKLKMSYELRDLINNQSSSNTQSNKVEECDHHHHHDCSKSAYRRMRCTPRRCDGSGHHQPEDCFKFPENTHKFKEWEDEKRSSGKWRNSISGGRGRGGGRSSNHSSAVRSYGNYTDHSHDPDEFLESLEHLKLEEREVTYNVETNGRYSCSMSSQKLAHQMGKRLNIGMLDSGASHYMLKDESLFVKGSLVENKDPTAVLRLAGGDATLPIKAFGQFAHRNSNGEKIIFNDVLLVPQLVHNLLAAGRLTRAGATTELLKDPHFRLVDRKKELFVGSFVGEGSLMFVGLNPSVIQHPLSVKYSKLTNQN